MNSPNYLRLNEIIKQLHRLEDLGQIHSFEYQKLISEWQELQDEIENYNEYCSIQGVD